MAHKECQGDFVKMFVVDRDKKILDEHLEKTYEEIFGKPKKEEEQPKEEPLPEITIPADIFKEEDYILALLPEDEKKSYQLLKERFLGDFELNTSSDEILLQNLIIDELNRLKLVQKKMLKPDDKDIDTLLEGCIGRINRTLELLGMLRKQRLSQKEKAESSLADLIVQFDKEKAYELRKEKDKEVEHETKIKRKRDLEIGGDYEKAIKVFVDKFGEIKEA